MLYSAVTQPLPSPRMKDGKRWREVDAFLETLLDLSEDEQRARLEACDDDLDNDDDALVTRDAAAAEADDDDCGGGDASVGGGARTPAAGAGSSALPPSVESLFHVEALTLSPANQTRPLPCRTNCDSLSACSVVISGTSVCA